MGLFCLLFKKDTFAKVPQGLFSTVPSQNLYAVMNELNCS